MGSAETFYFALQSLRAALFNCDIAVVYLSFLAFLNTAIGPKGDKQTTRQNHCSR